MPTEKLKEKIFDLRILARNIEERFPSVTSLYLFGSRNYQTGSLRSDIDVLVDTEEWILPADLRGMVENLCPALDLFICHGATAISCVNGSSINRGTKSQLLERLEAKRFWSRDEGFDTDARFKFECRFLDGVEYPFTDLRTKIVPLTYNRLKHSLKSQGLPTEPVLGENLRDILNFLGKICSRLLFDKDRLSASLRKQPFVATPTSEYDFQDLFYIACKPFIPDLRREQVETVFDGQKKVSDFHLIGRRIVIDFKYIDSNGKKAHVIKELDGLYNLYSKQIHCDAVLFVIFSETNGVTINPHEIEDEFTNFDTSPLKYTKVVLKT